MYLIEPLIPSAVFFQSREAGALGDLASTRLKFIYRYIIYIAHALSRILFLPLLVIPVVPVMRASPTIIPIVGAPVPSFFVEDRPLEPNPSTLRISSPSV